MRHHQRGFTLIEIAIVLVIIGLLLGGDIAATKVGALSKSQLTAFIDSNL